MSSGIETKDWLKGLDHQMDMTFEDIYVQILAKVTVAAGFGNFLGAPLICH